MPTEGNKGWDEQMQANENEQTGYKDLNMTLRLLAKKRNTLITEPPAAPKKPAIKATTEIEEPSTSTSYKAPDPPGNMKERPPK